MNYGLQLYSVRDTAEKDMELALKEVAAMGYSFVEFAGFQGKTPEEIKALLQKYNLTAVGTHTGLDQLTDEKYDETVAAHKTIGCDSIVIPYVDLSTKERIDAVVDRVNYLIPKLKEDGISLHYHNHDHEFKANKDGLTPEYELLNRTDILLEVDTYWVFNAGGDAVKFINEHKDRIRLIHLKDGIKNGEGCSLGLGEAKAAEVRKAALELGLKIIVESESLNPTGLEEVSRCADFLKAEDEKDNR